MRFLILFLFSFSLAESEAQHRDYAVFRDSIRPTICLPDSEMVAGTIEKLQRIDTNSTTENLHMYYSDLGFYYYLMYARNPLKNTLIKSIQYNNASLYHAPDFAYAIWNNLIAYSLLRDCSNVKTYLEKYKKVVPRRKWQKDQLKLIDRMCGSN